ncbi:uncharacterized protein LOC128865193 [Anastrepha ludens]|uniref:uncharacterized protein LOC128865193 n=1 Tax=Anastrepha ludens TaxID=28586 RepID=UPI0023AEB8BF|nr:uncharacterized protein LOC128865193 [Anastrepha ludens]
MANIKTATTTTISSENQFCMQLNASELTAIIMKGSPNSNDRDAGFCSGSSEGGDDLDRIDQVRLESSNPTSPADATTEASEDSVEVKVTPIALVRNKRKSSEPSKVVDATVTATGTHATALATAPLKKRIRYTSTTDSAVVLTPPALATPPPHGIWDPSQVLPHELMPNPAQVFVRHPGVTTLHRIPAPTVDEQLEPLALVAKKPIGGTKENEHTQAYTHASATSCTSNDIASPVYVPKKQQATANSQLKFHATTTESVPLALTTSANHLVPTKQASSHDALCASNVAEQYKPSNAEEAPSGSGASGSGGSTGSASARPQQRNYKNMTRERRIEANARERTRVHTISAAYETLRRAVPSYSNAQKLSKLSVLRIACSYILTLSRMAGHDYSVDGSEPAIPDCFDSVTDTIQTEGKIRKKKDE